MAMKTFAAIDVGSYEIAMKIYQISEKSGIKELEHLRRSIDMGTDTYTTGKLSYERVEELCRIMKEFRFCMDGYKVVSYQAYGTSAFREAENAVILLDQINSRTGIRIVILSNSEQRFFHYKAAAFMEEAFNEVMQAGAAIVDIGSGSIQISLFEKDTLVSTQNMRLGVLRLREHLAHLDVVPSQYEAILNEIIDSQMVIYKKLYLKEAYKNIIVVDDYLSTMINRQQKKADKGKANKLALEELLVACNTTPHSKLAGLFDIPEENIILLQISGTLLLRIMELMEAELIWAPGTTLCDGVVYDYAEKQKIIKPSHDFEQDIIACARNISKRYRGSRRRGELMDKIALVIFDSFKKIHGMGKRERLLLRLSAILHDCGKYISLVNLPECSYSIVMATEIIGISEAERLIIANVVKYNHQDFDYLDNFIEEDEIDRTSYLIVAKLTAILRVANGLDLSNKQKIKDVKATVKEHELILTVDADKDINLEKGLFEYSAYFFEEVFSIKPVVKRKKTI